MKFLLVAVAAAAIGAALALLYSRAHAPVDLVRQALEETGVALERADTADFESASGEPTIGERAAIFGLAARAEAAELRGLLVGAAALPRSATNDLLLETLLRRLAEIDADAALSVAAELEVDARQARELGLVLADVLGARAHTLDDILAVLPQLEARRFRVEALTRFALKEPEIAYREALALGDKELRDIAIGSVARIWVDRDPAGAVLQADLLRNNNPGRAFRASVIRGLALSDPDALVDYLNGMSQAPEQQSGLAGVVNEQLALLDAREAVELAERIGGRLGEAVKSRALRRWAEEAPLDAAVYAQSLPLGRERQDLLRAAATGYGAKDAEAAMAWAGSLDHAPPDIYSAVIIGVARDDPLQALELFASDAVPRSGFGSYFRVLNEIVSHGIGGNVPPRELASGIAALPDGQQRLQGLQMLVGVWAQSDLLGLMDWATADALALEAEDRRMVQQRLGSIEPAMAAAYTNRLPAETRDEWVAMIAPSYLVTDTQAALGWLAQFRGGSAYASAIAASVPQLVDYDPATAVELLGTLPATNPLTVQTTQQLATQWADRSSRDARQWITTLPAGQARDAALVGFINRTSRAQSPDAALLDLFESAFMRGQAVLAAAGYVAGRDPDEARRLVDRYVEDPAQRAQAEAFLSARRPAPGR